MLFLFLMLWSSDSWIIKSILPPEISEFQTESLNFVSNGVGKSVYGRTNVSAGHEAAFAVFLCCLCKIGALGTEDQLAMVFKVFTR